MSNVRSMTGARWARLRRLLVQEKEIEEWLAQKRAEIHREQHALGLHLDEEIRRVEGELRAGLREMAETWEKAR